MSFEHKVALVGATIRRFEQKLEDATVAAEGARRNSIEAEGAMKSRYNSTKEEEGYLAAGLEARNSEIVVGLSRIKTLRLPTNPESVVEGSLVRLDINGARESYLVLPYGGGEDIEFEGEEILVITPDSPLFQQMLGKRVGEGFTLERRGREKSYQITQID